MRAECRQAERPGSIEIGILSAMVIMLAVFEAVPSVAVGRLAVRTGETEMTGYDPGEIYEIPPELPDEVPVDIDQIISDIPVEIDPVMIVSMSDDTTGLSTVGTVDNPDIHHVIDPADGGIPEPGTFIPHSQAPLCTYRPMPAYPEMARLAGLEGRVTLMVFVSTEGVPLEVVLAQSSGIGSMDEAAADIAWESRWNPALRADGNPVGVWTSMIYEFSLE
jgi:TonB family protein